MKLSKDQKTLDQIAPLVEYAFLKKYDVRKDTNFMSRYNHSIGYGEFHDKKLQSYVMVNQFENQVFDHKVKMAGIGYVASYPENRGHGDITRIMKEILLDLHNNGVAISNLAPWSETFYRQYGYENAIYLKIYNIKPLMFRYFKAPKTGKLLRGRWSDPDLQKLVLDLYEKQLTSGEEQDTVIREKWWWDRLTTYYPGRYTAVYVDENDVPQAYMFYRIIGNEFVAEELYSTNKAGALGILSLIGSHISSCNNFKLIMPENSFIEEYFPDQEGIKVNTVPYMMSRIVDVSLLLPCLKAQGSNNVNIEITDDRDCSWNNGIWNIAITSDNRIKCQKVDGKPDFKGTITDWTKVLLGRLSLKRAVKLNLIERTGSQPLEFEKGVISFYDYF